MGSVVFLGFDEQRPSNRTNHHHVVFVWQELGVALQQNQARLGRTLEAGLRLQKLGCRSVGVSCRKLEARWRSLRRTVEREGVGSDRRRKLRNR